MKNKVVDPHYAKSAEYRRVLKKIAEKGKCPFCPANFKYHKKKVLRRTGGWFITRNRWGYLTAEHRFLIIGKAHKEGIESLTDKDVASILRLAQWAVRKFAIKGGALAFRFGDTARTGATVCHLHAHLIVPRLKKGKKRAHTVQFPIG